MKFFKLIPSNTQIDFIGKFKFFFSFSVIAFVFVIWKVSTGALNFGVDFTGGSVLQIRFKEAQTSEKVRALITELGDADA